MPKKKESNSPKNLLAELLAFLPNLVKEIAQEISDTVARSVSDTITGVQRKVFRKVAAAVLLFVGVIFASIGITLLLSQYLRISYGWSFLIVGCALWVGGVLLKKKLRA